MNFYPSTSGSTSRLRFFPALVSKLQRLNQFRNAARIEHQAGKRFKTIDFCTSSPKKGHELPTHKRARRERAYVGETGPKIALLSNLCGGPAWWNARDLNATTTATDGHKTKIVTARDQSIKRRLKWASENQSSRGDDISKKPINMSDTKLRLQRRCSEPARRKI